MKLLQQSKKNPLTLQLTRNLRRVLKRGHPWVFADNLRHRPPASPGTPALLLDHRRRELAHGFYDADSPLAFRVCTVDANELVDDAWADNRLHLAWSLRQMMFDDQTTGFRLINGEGDGLPGLVVDIYGDIGVITLDGAGPTGFWHSPGIAQWLAENLSLTWIYERRRGTTGRDLIGSRPPEPITFLENGVRFEVDVIAGQKTGFFLDQRDNRQQIRCLAQGKRLLNLFGYTGGFSVSAGLGGATHVTTVDVARPAIEAAVNNWQLNSLPPAQHEGIVSDAFEFLAEAAKNHHVWEMVVIDPPSFAPSQAAVKKAIPAYQKLIAAGATVVNPNGLLAAASCSSHITLEQFLTICEEGISLARRRATVLTITGQPADHPTPLVFSEFRYLKFVLMRVA